MKSFETIKTEDSEEKPNELEDLVDDIKEHAEGADVKLKPEVRKEIDKLVEKTEKGEFEEEDKGPFSNESLWKISQDLEKKSVTGDQSTPEMSQTVIENLHDKDGRVIYQRYFKTEEGQDELKYLSRKAKELFEASDQAKKTKIFGDLEGVKNNLEKEIGGIITIEENGDIFVTVDGKKEKVFSGEERQKRKSEKNEENKNEIDLEELKEKDYDYYDLKHIENAEIPYLEGYKDKDCVIDLTGFKVESLTMEKIKLFKQFKGICLFSDKVRKMIDSFEE